MKDKRPVNLDIGSIHLPLPAYTSILHRISGVVLFIGIGLLLWVLDYSLSSEENFLTLQDKLHNPLMKFIIWAVLAALLYHLVAGAKHLLMDMGIGESKEGGRLGAALTLIFSLILILLAGVWLW